MLGGNHRWAGQFGTCKTGTLEMPASSRQKPGTPPAALQQSQAPLTCTDRGHRFTCSSCSPRLAEYSKTHDMAGALAKRSNDSTVGSKRRTAGVCDALEGSCTSLSVGQGRRRGRQLPPPVLDAPSCGSTGRCRQLLYISHSHLTASLSCSVCLLSFCSSRRARQGLKLLLHRRLVRAQALAGKHLAACLTGLLLWHTMVHTTVGGVASLKYRAQFDWAATVPVCHTLPAAD